MIHDLLTHDLEDIIRTVEEMQTLLEQEIQADHPYHQKLAQCLQMFIGEGDDRTVPELYTESQLEPAMYVVENEVTSFFVCVKTSDPRHPGYLGFDAV